MENITLRRGDFYLRELLAYAPGTALRHSVLTMLRDALVSSNEPDDMIRRLEHAAAPLCEALGVLDLDEIPDALRALEGRPGRKVSAAMRSAELAGVIRIILDGFGLLKLADRVGTWGPPQAAAAELGLPLSDQAMAARAQLVVQLRQRAEELHAEWQRQHAVLRCSIPIDGRSRVAAARAWQVPMITGSVPSAPEATSSRYPNRLGRTAAVVAYSAMPAALDGRCCAPSSWVFESLALLVAVAESVSEPVRRPGLLRGSGVDSRVVVRVGGEVGDEQFDLDYWWTVLDSWGSHSPAVARAVSTAWRLSLVEADALVWALCSVAVRLAVAAAAPNSERRLMDPDPWPGFVREELPRWDVGAQSVWALMQSTRAFESRVVWPGDVSWSLGDVSSWPWQLP